MFRIEGCAMNNEIAELDVAEDEALISEASDEALEVAANVLHRRASTAPHPYPGPCLA
jgi:hypothetical protein